MLADAGRCQTHKCNPAAAHHLHGRRPGTRFFLYRDRRIGENKSGCWTLVNDLINSSSFSSSLSRSRGECFLLENSWSRLELVVTFLGDQPLDGTNDMTGLYWWMHLGNKGGRLLLQLGNCLQYILVHLINATRSCLDKEVLSAGEECIMHFYSNVGIKYALVKGSPCGGRSGWVSTWNSWKFTLFQLSVSWHNITIYTRKHNTYHVDMIKLLMQVN